MDKSNLSNPLNSDGQPPQSRTGAKKKAHELAHLLRSERPDYAYLKDVFRYLRAELEIEVPRASRKLPFVPSEDQIQRYYQAVWKAENFSDMVLIKTLLYTGIRVGELVSGCTK